MNFKVKGKITSISEVQTFDSGAKKLSFQVETTAQYNNLYSFDVFKNADNIQHLNNFIEYNKIGNEVEVEFNIQCKEYNGKYYTNLQMWKCSKVTEEPTAVDMGDDSDSDSLPF